jgi:hypothetical protein
MALIAIMRSCELRDMIRDFLMPHSLIRENETAWKGPLSQYVQPRLRLLLGFSTSSSRPAHKWEDFAELAWFAREYMKNMVREYVISLTMDAIEDWRTYALAPLDHDVNELNAVGDTVQKMNEVRRFFGAEQLSRDGVQFIYEFWFHGRPLDPQYVPEFVWHLGPLQR